MILTTSVKLDTTTQTFASLLDTLKQANLLAQHISQFAFKYKIFSKSRLQKEFYHQLRKEHPTLSSQMVIRAIAKVANAYKINKKVEVQIRELGSIAFDARLLTWWPQTQRLSIWSVDGRLKLSYLPGKPQQTVLSQAVSIGESKLVLRAGAFYLLKSEVSRNEAAPIERKGMHFV